MSKRKKLHIENWRLNSVMRCRNFVFRLGACHGMFDEEEGAVRLIAIANDSPGNGDFERAMTKLETRARGMGKKFQVVEIWNERLKTHLVSKRGYQDKGAYVETA